MYIHTSMENRRVTDIYILVRLEGFSMSCSKLNLVILFNFYHVYNSYH